MPNYVSRHSGEQIDKVIDQAILSSGGAMEGPLVLGADPIQDLEAATKQYVDEIREDLDVAVQGTEPENPEEGDLWIDTSEEGNTEESEYIPLPFGAVANDLLIFNGTSWTTISKADLISEIIAALPAAEEASF